MALNASEETKRPRNSAPGPNSEENTKGALVKLVEVQDQPTLEDVGGDPTKKAVEGLRKIYFGDDPER